MPVAAPDTYAVTKKITSDDVTPSRLVDTAAAISPTISSLRRPIRSDR